MNVSTNSFHYLLCLVGTAQKLSSKRLLPVGEGCKGTCIAKVVKSRTYLHPSDVNGGLMITNLQDTHILTSSSLQIPGIPCPTADSHTIIAWCTLVIISANPWWRPVFFDSCQIALIMSLQLAHSQTHLGVGSLLPLCRVRKKLGKPESSERSGFCKIQV